MFQYLTPASPNFIQAIASGFRLVKDVNTDAVAARGDIVFNSNFVAGDTVTINGTVFTAVASGAAGNQFNIAGTLTLSLDALVIVLNASVVAGVAVATYSKVSTTTLRTIYDTAGDAGNAFSLAASVPIAGVSVPYSRLTGGAAAEIIDLGAAETYALTVSGAGDSALALPAGLAQGQEVTLWLKTRGSTGNVVVTPSAITGGTTLTLDAVGEFAKLKWLGSTWRIIANTSTLA